TAWLRQCRHHKCKVLTLVLLVLLWLLGLRKLLNAERESRRLLDAKRVIDLKTSVEEIMRIRSRVSAELLDLESGQLQLLQSDVSEYKRKVEQLQQQMLREQTQLELELERIKISRYVEQAHQRNTPELTLPLCTPLLSALPRKMSAVSSCRMHNCFDRSRCSLTSGFPVYLYDPDAYSVQRAGYPVDGLLKATLKQTLALNAHVVRDPEKACIYLVLVGDATVMGLEDSTPARSNSPIDAQKLHQLPHWAGDGRNHVLLNLAMAKRDSNFNFNSNPNPLLPLDTMRAIVLQSSFEREQFRPHFDLIVPPLWGPAGGDVWQECSSMVPARRKFLLTFQGELRPAIQPLDDLMVEHLKNLSHIGHRTQDLFLLQLQCEAATEVPQAVGAQPDWTLCGSESSRKQVLQDSSYALVLPPWGERVSSTLMLARLYEALRSGAVPVILGADELQLPYAETIDWRRAALLLPRARITELHFLLRAVPAADLLLLRRQGRLLWERYLSSVQATVDTLIASLRDRLGIPPLPMASVVAQSVFNDTSVPLTLKSEGQKDPPYPSPAFRRNYTTVVMQAKEAWNDWMDPFHLYPQLPFDPPLPSEARFMGAQTEFRPIGRGIGGAGKEFSKALGGNYPREQFTIVILTYERSQLLMRLLSSLQGLPHLHKVVVVWNSPQPPLDDLSWPVVGVPVSVVRAPRNSLNNRFLPFDVIETEAVFSVDDDAHLQHDEILFAFRIWREQRDRIVGFPGRYHAWNASSPSSGSWSYSWSCSCELSMVLTGAAFLHRHYLYLYSHQLPQAIRDKVDELMNCEDIAMNFLVSHLTRRPPIKVTGRSRFGCVSCGSLSKDDSHFEERHKCINFFSQVFGYTPLLYTQYRADSVLYRMRLPSGKHKCFRHV
ncbi:hypothetical protein KR044_007870, partial [Drosophila immigrans]